MVVSTSGYKVYIYRYVGQQYIINQTINYTYLHARRAWLSYDNNYLAINNKYGSNEYNTEIR